MLFYLAYRRGVEMNPGEELIASCGNRKCLTHGHVARQGELPPKRRTPRYTLEQWASMNGEVVLKEQLLKITS